MDFTVYLQCDAKKNPFLLKKIENKTILEHTISKIRRIGAYPIISSVYDCEENHPMLELLKSHHDISVICTDEENVNRRFLRAVKNISGYVIRVGGDQALLDAEESRRIVSAMTGYDFFYEESMTNCVLPDVVSVECLKAHFDDVMQADRYFVPLAANDDVLRLRLQMPLVLLKCRINDFLSYRLVKSVIENDLDVFALGNTFVRRLNSCSIYKNGILNSWFLGNSARDFFYDENEEVNPWWCEAAVNITKDKLSKRKNLKVFEWGAGNSTLFWSRYAEKVVSIEYDPDWFNRIKGVLPSNVELRYCELEYDGDYCRSIMCEEDEFDVILIDGRDRVRCAKNCVSKLKADGIVIWDNSNRDYYEDGYTYLYDLGFRRIELSGVIWGIPEMKDYTSFFYRDNNIFGF